MYNYRTPCYLLVLQKCIDSLQLTTIYFISLKNKGRLKMTITKDILIELIRDKMNCSVKEAKEILEILLEEIKSNLGRSQDVKISGFGKWSIRQKNARPGRNPHTGKKIEISARKVVTFHPSDKLRESVNSPAQSEGLSSHKEAL